MVTIDGSDVADAKHKACSAMSAYAPLASRIFSSQWIYPNLKMLFKDSLVLSRLLLNAHIRVPSAKFIRILSNAHMRV
eukprot:4582777-Karenia_brevis.AAC.1